MQTSTATETHAPTRHDSLPMFCAVPRDGRYVGQVHMPNGDIALVTRHNYLFPWSAVQAVCEEWDERQAEEQA